MSRGTLLLCFAATAHAAPGSSGPSPAAAPSGPAPAATPASMDVEAELAARASEAFRRGDERFAVADFEGALADYTRAYELLPDYKALYNIGSANVRLSRWAAARRAFSLYLELGRGKAAPERVEQVRRYLDVLRRKTATLNLTLNVPDAEVHIDGARIRPTEFSGLVVEPGEHVVRVSKPGFRPVEQVLQATDGEELRLVLPLMRSGAPEGPALAAEPAPAPPEVRDAPARWVPWALTGTLAAGWGATAALAIEARRDRDRIERPGTPAERIDSARRLHLTLAVVSDVLLASALASAGVSAYLTWWPEAPESAPAAGAHGLGGMSVGVRGAF